MILEAGELDTRITLQRKSKVNDKGTVREAWVDLGTFWAKLGTINQKILELARGFAPTVNYEAKLRYQGDVDNSCRAIIRGTNYEINGVLHDPGQVPQWTQLFLTRVTG